MAILLPACPTACTGDSVGMDRQAATSLVLYDNGDPSGGFGVTILSELDAFNQVGDDFDLAVPVTVDVVEWWGDGDGDDFSLRVFEIVAGVPQTTALFDIDLGQVTGDSESFPGGEHLFYQAELPDLDLPAGSYLLSIVDNQGGSETRWFWSASCEDGCEDNSFRRMAEGDAWTVGNWDFAFRLLGSYVGKVELCHCSGGPITRCKTLELPSSAVSAHLTRHAADHLGACEP